MARYRKIDVRMWGDEKFRRLSASEPCAQMLWIYLLTNPDTVNVPGLYRAGEAGLAEALNWPLKAFRLAFAEAYREGMVKADWENRVIWVPKAIVYNEPESHNVVKSWRSSWDEIPECSLKIEAHQSLLAFLKGKGEGFANAFLEACNSPEALSQSEPSPNQEQEQEQEQKETLVVSADDTPKPTPEHLVSLWNNTAHLNLPRVRVLSEAVRAKARARLNEYPEAEFWKGFLERVNRSKFLRGDARGRDGGKPFRATFEWIVSESNFAKVVNGNYDDGK